ncbi:ATP-binding protein [Nocardioides nanhaiensis]|uniref:ATP-binding protein n=1 Tax=Nocardioides nanhaiensis TaxID=1476871 RepID=A0ABP8WD77_9ACTN
MTLNRPALALGNGPRGVHDARRWIAGGLREMGREDLVEAAEIGTSELVTNALLHGEAPISVTLGGTPEHPRVEVRDASRERPVLPTEPDPAAGHDSAGLDGLEGLDGLDDVLLTFGRGLGIVARAAQAWGADIDEDGKVVWFTPAAEIGEEEAVGTITGESGPSPASGDEQPTELVVEQVPVAAYLSFQRHYRELRREVRLLALAHEQEYPLAKTLSDLFGSLERVLRDDLGADQAERARAQGRPTTDLRVRLRKDDERRLERLSELLDLADAFCREERLLSVARTPEQESFQRWFLAEVLRQAAGEGAVAWETIASRPAAGPQGLPSARSSVS